LRTAVGGEMEQEEQKGKCKRFRLWLKGKCKASGYWLGRNWWMLLLVVLLASFIAGYIVTHYQLGISDKYTILADLVLIILALVGIAGVGVYLLIRTSVEEHARRIIREGRNFTRAETQVSIGFWYYEQYLAEIKRTEEMKEIRGKLTELRGHLKNEGSSETGDEYNNKYLEYLRRAVARTERALGFLKELDEKEYEEQICACKNNMAYYLAEMQKRGIAGPGDRELAKSYANYIQKRIQKYPHRRDAWTDTCDHVKQYIPD